MKPVIILSLLLLGVNFIHAQYTLVPDPNFEAYLEDNGMGDGVPGNGQVLTANIENVTEIQVPGFTGIQNLIGIEDFVALEYLDFGYNPITELDLSQNVNLIDLRFGYTLIPSLDLSTNNQLVSLICIANTQLTSLIVNSPYITDIDAFENGLSTIDVTNCPALERLNVYYNYLQHIDISNNPALTFLRCNANPLQSLDTSNNPLLNNLKISHSLMTSIDLSQNPLLSQFTIAHSPNLTSIDMRNDGNEIMEFFSANPNASLKCVYVDDAAAPYLEEWNIPNHAHFVNNEQECDAISVGDYQKPLFSMYPNPAKERVTVISESSGTYMLYSSEGKIVVEGIIVAGFNRITLSEFNTGIYFLEIETADGKEVKRIVKR